MVITNSIMQSLYNIILRITTEELLYLQYSEDKTNINFILIGLYIDLKPFEISIELNNKEISDAYRYLINRNHNNDTFSFQQDRDTNKNTVISDSSITVDKSKTIKCFEYKIKRIFELDSDCIRNNQQVYKVSIPLDDTKSVDRIVLSFRLKCSNECYIMYCNFQELKKLKYVKFNLFELEKFKIEYIQRIVEDYYIQYTNMINSKEYENDRNILHVFCDLIKLRRTVKDMIVKIKKRIDGFDSRYYYFGYIRRLYKGFSELCFSFYKNDLIDTILSYDGFETFLTQIKAKFETENPLEELAISTEESTICDDAHNNEGNNLNENTERSDWDEPSNNDSIISIVCILLVCIISCCICIYILIKYNKQNYSIREVL